MAQGSSVHESADEETRAQLRGSWNGGWPPTSSSLAGLGGGGGWGGAGRWLRVGLQPHSGSCYLRSRVCSAGETQHQAVRCDRVSLSARNMSLRPRPKGLHTLAASPLPSAVGGSRFISEGGCVGFRCLLQIPSNQHTKPCDLPSPRWRQLHAGPQTRKTVGKWQLAC